MEKIRILCDTSSDISKELAAELGIVMFPIPVTWEDKSLQDGVDYTYEEFYQILDSTTHLPTTSHIPLSTTSDAYLQAYNDGCEAVIHVCNNSANSGMFSTANIAKKMFFEEHPEAEGKFRIEPVDSHTFTLAYGFPVIKGAQLRNNGGTVDEILALMDKIIFSSEIYMVVYDLKIAKQSGRVNAAAAFAGSLLGIRPIMSMIHGVSASVDKLRGDSKVISRLVQCVKDNVDEDKEFAVVYGYPEREAIELEQAVSALGMKSLGLFRIGAAVGINIGPKAMAVVILGKDRRETQA